MSLLDTFHPVCRCGRRVGIVAFQIYGSEEKFCSRACMTAAQEGRKKRKRRVKEDKSADFGGALIVEHRCDFCHGPISLAWGGRNGEYCSNACLEKAERKDDMRTEDLEDDVELNGVDEPETETEETEEVEEVKPSKKAKKLVKKVVAPVKTTKTAAPAKAAPEKKAPAKVAKKVAKPAAAKAAAPAKAPKKAPKKGGAGVMGLGPKVLDEKKIKVLIKESPYRPGNRTEIFKLAKTGQTVADFREAVVSKGYHVSVPFFLNLFLEHELISLS